MALRVMRYPLKRFLWQYIINVHQYLPLVWCQRRSKSNFPVVSPFKNPFLPQIQHDKVTYKIRWMLFIEKHYLLKLFFRQYIINLQQWLKLVWCQRRFKRDFPVVSPFKNSFLPQIQHDKVIYKIRWILFIEMHYPLKLFLRQYIINLQQSKP